MRATHFPHWIIWLLLVILLIALLFLTPHPVQSRQDQPIARVVILVIAGCRHCDEVVQRVVPALRATYGDRLDLRMFDVMEGSGRQIWSDLHERMPDLPPSVPQAFIESTILIGTSRIEEDLPSAIDACLANGGCDWPFDIESAYEPTPEPQANCAEPTTDICELEAPATEHWGQRFFAPTGVLSLLIIIVLILVGLWVTGSPIAS